MGQQLLAPPAKKERASVQTGSIQPSLRLYRGPEKSFGAGKRRGTRFTGAGNGEFRGDQII